MNTNIKKILEALVYDNGSILVDSDWGNCQYCNEFIDIHNCLHKPDCIVELAKKELASSTDGKDVVVMNNNHITTAMPIHQDQIGHNCVGCGRPLEQEDFDYAGGRTDVCRSCN